MEEKSPPALRRQRAGIPEGRGRNLGSKSGPASTATTASLAVGALFRSARELQPLSQHQVAAMSDGTLSRTTISDIERGQSLPNLEALVCLSRVLHVDPIEVLEKVDLVPRVPVDVTGLSLEELGRQAESYFWASSYRSALAVYDAMLDRVLLDPPGESERRRLQSRIEINRAVALRQCSALKAAEIAVKRAVQTSDGLPELQAEAFMVLASLYSFEGVFVLASNVADRAVALAELGTAKLRGQAWSQKGNVLFRMGNHEEARRAFWEAR